MGMSLVTHVDMNMVTVSVLMAMCTTEQHFRHFVWEILPHFAANIVHGRKVMQISQTIVQILLAKKQESIHVTFTQ
jgi:hypothetical protein